jgi:hypothetical protein
MWLTVPNVRSILVSVDLGSGPPLLISDRRRWGSFYSKNMTHILRAKMMEIFTMILYLLSPNKDPSLAFFVDPNNQTPHPPTLPLPYRDDASLFKEKRPSTN